MVKLGQCLSPLLTCGARLEVRAVVTSSGASNLLLAKLEVPCWVPLQNGMFEGLLHVSSCAGFSA